MSNEVASHYTQGTLGDRIKAGLNQTVTDGRPVTIDELAPVDEFHIGGRPASIHLFDQLNLTPEDAVLNIGAGIGGTA